jgi:hypothetical protein
MFASLTLKQKILATVILAVALSCLLVGYFSQRSAQQLIENRMFEQELPNLTQRIGKSANEALTIEGVSPEALFLLGKDLNSFRDIARGLLDGNADLRLTATRDPALRARLEALLDRVREDDTVSYRSFRDSEELERLLRDDLAVVLAERFLVARRVSDRTTSKAPKRSGGRAAISSRSP